MLPLDPEDCFLDLEGQLVRVPVRGSRAVFQPAQSLVLITVEDFVAGLALGVSAFPDALTPSCA